MVTYELVRNDMVFLQGSQMEGKKLSPPSHFNFITPMKKILTIWKMLGGQGADRKFSVQGGCASMRKTIFKI